MECILEYLMVMVSALVVWRLYAVMQFIRFCDEMNDWYGERHPDNPFGKLWFKLLVPPLHRMFFSFKPLTLKAWFKAEDIKKIKS